MDIDSDLHLTQGNASQNTPVAGLTTAECGDKALNADSIPDNPSPTSPEVYSSLVPDAGDDEAHEEQDPVHTFSPGEDPSESRTEISRTANETVCVHGDSVEAVSPSECTVVPTSETTSLKSINSIEATAIARFQDSPSLCARTITSKTAPHDERRADSDDLSNHVQLLHAESDCVQIASPARLADEEQIREDFYEGFPSSVLPSSSPPQIFSSSPYASSESSLGDIEPSKMVFAAGVNGCASSHDCADGDVESVTRNHSHLGSEDLNDYESTEVAMSPELGGYISHQSPGSSCIGNGSMLSEKQSDDPDESPRSQRIKRLKLDPRLHQPPAPKRVTLASQNRQFKKLAAPFRPPLKLPIVTDELAQTTNDTNVESTIRATLETRQDKNDLQRSSANRKSSNTARSATQFKSPLINAVFPTDSRTIRLTPALQTLERKLQVLRRAIKVKQENEEEVLTRLTGKWIEAGREVAYDLWDATKNVGEFGVKTTFVHRSHGYRDALWGWDTKVGDASEGCRSTDPSGTPCTTGRLTPEGNDDVGHNTLGTMLRQFGIAPEIFGWDDDSEAFSD